MTISVLDRTDGTAEASLGNLHDEAGKVDETNLPCRVNNPELWFAESPERRGVRQGALHRLPGPRPVLRRRSRASRAVGRLGWTALHPGRRRPPQASAWPSPQERGGRVAATRRPSADGRIPSEKEPTNPR